MCPQTRGFLDILLAVCVKHVALNITEGHVVKSDAGCLGEGEPSCRHLQRLRTVHKDSGSMSRTLQPQSGRLKALCWA
jgi:hypothetical protein